LQASRTVNQAIGRVIRHVKDYGCIFLCDERFSNNTIEISKWMKDRKRIWDRRNVDKLQDEVQKFFELNIERFKEVKKKKRKRDEVVPATNPEESGVYTVPLDYDTEVSMAETNKRQKLSSLMFSS